MDEIMIWFSQDTKMRCLTRSAYFALGGGVSDMDTGSWYSRKSPDQGARASTTPKNARRIATEIAVAQ